MALRAVTALAFLSGMILLSLGCGQRQQQPKSESPDGYVGNWKVDHPTLGTYFMTLNPDGSGNSTRTGGELGKWQSKADYIELEWTPKNLTLYFDPGSSAAKTNPSLTAEGSSVAEKVEKIPASSP